MTLPGPNYSPQLSGALPNANFSSKGLLMSSFAVSERPRSRRAKYPKVRTGCVSCKKRHVKCDEAKPSCHRCLKWSGVCGGYSPPRSKSCPADENATDPTQRPLLMRETSTPTNPYLRNCSISSPSIQSSDPETPPLPPGGLTMEAADTSSFQTSILDATFWTETVPRLVQENLAVRYANMAVHILILSKQPELMSDGGSEPSSDQYSQALAHYGLALRQMRHSIDTAGDPRAAILCSMFFVIFEAVNGDKDAVESHLYSGQRLLENMYPRITPTETGTSSKAVSLRKELRHLLQYISLQVRISGVNCWRQDVDALYSETLEEYFSENYAAGTSSSSTEYADLSSMEMWTEGYTPS